VIVRRGGRPGNHGVLDQVQGSANV